MSLKIHLFIVSFIILSVFVFWQWMQSHRVAPVESVTAQRTVEIIRASWGLNCPGHLPPAANTAIPAGPFSQRDEQPALRENNVLQVISALCNGKPECAIRNSPDALGSNPSPECTEKEMLVEYRCFSYDRPWLLRIDPRATGVIHCQDAPEAIPQ